MLKTIKIDDPNICEYETRKNIERDVLVFSPSP